MPLTDVQNSAIKTYVQGDQTLNGLPHNSDSAFQIAGALNAAASPAWYVFRTNMPKSEVQNLIGYAAMTPAQAIPSNNTAEALQIWIAKCLLAQSKQFNLQNLMVGTLDTTINFALSGNRTAFQDALTALPTKDDGTTQAAGWVALQLAFSRAATVVEKLLATGVGTKGSPGLMTFEGSVSSNDVQTAMGW